MTKKLMTARRFIAAGVLTAFMFVGIASVNAQLTDGLVAHWPLDEINGETTPDVVSGYDMTADNLTADNVVEGKYGNAISFSNAEQTLLWRKNEEGDALPANQHDSFTISFWSKIQGNGQNDLRVFSESNTQGNNSPLFNIGTKNNGSDGTIDIYIRSIGGGPTVGHIFSTAEPFDDEWHHVVFVQNDLERSIYVDGELDDLEIGPKVEGDTAVDATTIGGILRGNASHWVTGLIDDVAIWTRALSADEVSELTGSGIPTGGGELVPGLIAYWPFDGDLQDAVGDSHGEAMGSDDIAYDSGKFGQGIDLDGVDQFVQTPVENEEMFDFQDGTGFSISAWFSVNEFSKNWQALIAKGEGNRWRVHRRGGENILTGNGGNADVPGGTGDINDGELHHIVLVSDPENGEVRLYSDGELVSTGGAPAIQSNENPMMIGENPDARNRTWSGIIDDVGIWNRPLTEDEIVQLGENSIGALIGGGGGPLVPGLIAYWPFDSASEIIDLVAGIEGEIQGELEAVEGHLGGAVDLGEADNWIRVDAEETGWLAPASDNNAMSVSLWQKLNVVRNSSTFWFRAASAPSNARNFQAHIPWGNNNIYFDTGGCCGGGDTRIVKNSTIDFLEWHHFVFIKDEDHKEIWVDGELFHEGENTTALFDDWTYLAIGSSGTGDYAAAIVDDFGVWARAITPDEIASIWNGGSGSPLMTDALSAGANTIAVEIHQASGSSSDIRFDMMLRGETSQGGGDNVSAPLFFAEPAILRTRSYNTGNEEWSALTEAFFTIEGATVDASNLVVSELHYHPATPSTPAELAESSDRDDFEFLEFLNIGRAALNLTGIRFAAGINFAFPDNTVLKAGERLLLIRNRAAFEARYGPIEGIQSFEYTGRLNNDGEQLLITGDGQKTIHDFTYNDQLPWPKEGDGAGSSLILVNPAEGPPHGKPASWTTSRYLGGSPGKAEPAGLTYTAWAASNGIKGKPNDDDDRDGLSNYWEFLFGSRPDLASDAPVFGLTVQSIDVDGVVNDYLFLTFRKNLSANASLTVEVSSDLITWSPDPATIKPVSKADNGDGTATVTFRFADPVGQGQSRNFIRLRGN